MNYIKIIDIFKPAKDLKSYIKFVIWTCFYLRISFTISKVDENLHLRGAQFFLLNYNAQFFPSATLLLEGSVQNFS
jgi:hypothetical protein